MMDDGLLEVKNNKLEITDKLIREWFGQKNIGNNLKRHWLKDGNYICNYATSISLDKISPDKEHVTCKNCLNILDRQKKQQPQPLQEKILYTAQILTEDTATVNFVSKEVFERHKEIPYSLELFEKKEVKSAVEWLKEQLKATGKLRGQSMNDRNEITTLVEKAFPDICKKP